MLDEFPSTLDYGVFAFSLLISIGTGIYHAVKTRLGGGHEAGTSKDEYLMGGRKMPMLPVALSLLTSFLSGILMIGVPAEIYQRGVLQWMYLMMGPFASLITSFVFLPVFHKMRSTCLHEYFVHRYNSWLIRRMFSCIFCFFTLSYMAIVIYAPSVALSEVLRIDKSWLIIIFGVSTTLYTCIGGLKAVVWADSLQAVMMYGGVFSLIIRAFMHPRVGGVGRVAELAWDTGRIQELARVDWRIDQYNSIWINMFSGTINWCAMYGVNQLSIQRYCSLPTVHDAQKIIYYTLLPFIILCSMVSGVGLLVLAYYDGCDPMEALGIKDKDHIVIMFARDILHPVSGLFGLYVSCIMAATLSTLSSGMNSTAAAIYEDFLKRFWDHKISDSRATLVNKVLTIGIGLLATCLAFATEYLGGIIRVALSVMGAMAGPMVAIFVLAIFFPRSGPMSSLVSFVLSNLLMMVICGFSYMENPYDQLHLSTNTTWEGCEGLHATNITRRTPPAFDAHYGNPDTWFISRISPYAYAGLGFVLMLSIGVPLTFFEKANEKIRYLTWVGRNDPWPESCHEFDLLTETETKEKKKLLEKLQL